ncbi:sensor histidine kinase [Myroides odoratimimus]|uniref:sensor histidine kinase n=1 Tax=Myroides odoratimimus TaxID=76832 RepID=UPI002DBB2A4A|nr:sensor histidine kinase [Myroides odoratimimus]MEC4028517.1 sensor histidine kinase [Myroides odoratimimus]
MSDKEDIIFTVDAGIINRLGLELVGKSETALAELIKNSYDADANVVSLYFEDAYKEGGNLIIEDDGVGMNKEQLINGFMRLATTDKIHNSVSEKYQRPKAGRKGIGRFSTQRLGESLDIITQSKSSDQLHLSIDWNAYKTDKEISEIKNKLEVINGQRKKGDGTSLCINRLREKWSDADIKRVYRYVSDLIQPNLLKIDNEGFIIDENKQEGFEVKFLRRDNPNEEWIPIADPQVMMLDRALATFSGYIDNEGNGRCNIKTKSFSFNHKKDFLSEEIIVSGSPYEALKGAQVAFKAFYFIGGDRQVYYGITKAELNVILNYLDNNGGIKLYRNGFRVPKYGNLENDWLNIDKNSRIGKGIPFNNNRLIGFVQLMDSNGEVFEESAGREGLIEKEAFLELQQFVSKALQEGFLSFASWFRNSDEYKIFNPDKKDVPTTDSVQKNLDSLKEATKTLTNPDATDEEKQLASNELEKATKKFASDTKAAINELEMMRILAATGLTISEFVHEIKQIVPSTKGYIKETLRVNLDNNVKYNLEQINEVLSSLEAYTSYFDETISKNVLRELKEIDTRKVVNSFKEVVGPDLIRRNIDMQLDLKGQDLITVPMHPSEWNTILQNLYSNAKKAIVDSSVPRGKILIKIRKNIEENIIEFEFQDNGVGIPQKNKEKIFDPFFTTSKERNDDLGTNTGLGLYILYQMINNRGGKITLGSPDNEFKTNIKITLPLA